MGPLQEIINVSKLAQAKCIRQLSTDLSETNGIPILSVTFVTAMDDKDEEGEIIFLRAAYPVQGKEAAQVFRAVIEIIDTTRTRYESWLRNCKKCGVDIRKFPPSSEIRLEMMNVMSLSITDGAIAAKKVSKLLKDHLRELAEVGIAQEDLDMMSEVERLRVSLCMEFTCKFHSRCLIGVGMVDAETSLLRVELNF